MLLNRFERILGYTGYWDRLKVFFCFDAFDFFLYSRGRQPETLEAGPVLEPLGRVDDPFSAVFEKLN